MDSSVHPNELERQYVRQVIWRPDEKNLLVHISGTNQLHLMSLTKKPQNQYFAEEGEDIKGDSDFDFDDTSREDSSLLSVAWSIRDRIWNSFVAVTPFIKAMLDKPPTVFSLQIPQDGI